MSKITYSDKVTLNENPNVADINKVKADDLNEIKNVVNANDDNVGDLADLKTTDVSSVVNAINEVFDISHYVIEKKGDYVYKKYDNGLVEISQLSDTKIDLVTSYQGTTLYFGYISFTLPESLKELYSINVSVADTTDTSLLGCNYRTWPNLTGYKLFVYDYGYSRSNKSITIYTYIVGKWK